MARMAVLVFRRKSTGGQATRVRTFSTAPEDTQQASPAWCGMTDRRPRWMKVTACRDWRPGTVHWLRQARQGARWRRFRGAMHRGARLERAGLSFSSDVLGAWHRASPAGGGQALVGAAQQRKVEEVCSFPLSPLGPHGDVPGTFRSSTLKISHLRPDGGWECAHQTRFSGGTRGHFVDGGC